MRCQLAYHLACAQLWLACLLISMLKVMRIWPYPQVLHERACAYLGMRKAFVSSAIGTAGALGMGQEVVHTAVALMDRVMASGVTMTDLYQNLFVCVCLRLAAVQEGAFLPNPAVVSTLAGVPGASFLMSTPDGWPLAGAGCPRLAVSSADVFVFCLLLYSAVHVDADSQADSTCSPAAGVLERMEANVASILPNDTECISTVHCLKVSPQLSQRCKMHIYHELSQTELGFVSWHFVHCCSCKGCLVP